MEEVSLKSNVSVVV